MTQKPHRQYELSFSVSADSHNELCKAMNTLALWMERGEIEDSTHTGCSGGVGWSHTLSMKIDRDMTAEQFYVDLEAYLSRPRETSGVES